MSDSPELFARACEYHQANRLPEAEQLYRQILRIDPQHADALCFLGAICQISGRLEEAAGHLRQALERAPQFGTALKYLAIVLAQQGKLEEAAAWLERLLSDQPNDAEGWNNLGLVRLGQGRLDAAVECYECAIHLNPDLAVARANLQHAVQERERSAGLNVPSIPLNQDGVRVCIAQGIALGGQRRFAEAAACFRQALQGEPDSADAHFYLGLALEEQGHFMEAIASYGRALEIDPQRRDAAGNLGNLGNLRVAAGDLKAAVACYQQFLRCKPDHHETHYNLGLALAKQGRTQDAIAAYRNALRLKPDYTEAHNNLGIALESEGHLDDALGCYEEAIRLQYDYVQAHTNMGKALARQGHLDKAIACHQRAIRINPGWAIAHHNLAAVFMEQGRFDDALASYEQALRIEPNLAEAHANRALLLLLRGDFEHGWREYEWRWRQPNWDVRSFSQPRWDGSSLAGQTILLHAEQGLGDTIQFLRYAPLVKNRGGRVVVECQPALCGLAESCPGVDFVLPRGSTLPTFDVQAPLLSLPYILGDTLSTIPAAIPYLAPDSARLEFWQKELAAERKFKVGIVWQGSRGYKNDRRRSVPLDQFAPLADVPDVALFSLQVGPGTEQIAASRVPLTDLGGRFDSRSLVDLAAVLQNLDLLITVDTAPAHLAGALGRPVWVTLPAVPDWRWLLHRSDSPWYSTARLFRQPRAGDWPRVFTTMTKALGDLVQERGSTKR